MNLVPLQPDFPKSFPESSKKILEEDLDESRPRRLSSLNDLTSAEAEAPCTPPNKPRKYSKKFKSLSKKTKSERKYEGSFDSIINEDFCAPLDLEFKLYPPGVCCLKFSDSNTQPSSEGASSLDSKSDLPGFEINSPLMPSQTAARDPLWRLFLSLQWKLMIQKIKLIRESRLFVGQKTPLKTTKIDPKKT